jgi:thiol-disulfide isomerase/thioredoxin
MKLFLAVVFGMLLAYVAPCFAREKAITPDLSQISDRKVWTVINADCESAMEDGKRVVRLRPKGTANTPSDIGLALVGGVEFAEGTVEIDLKGKGKDEASFLGIAFGVVDDKTFEAVYFRPFNFMREGDSYREHAVQYVAWPEHAWEKLRKAKPGVYESAVKPVPDPAGWFHAHIEVTKKKVSVWVDDAKDPCLVVERLASRDKGKVGLWVDSKDGAFRSLEIRPAPTLKVGDPAPSMNASKWLQGDKVNRFEPGKSYVIEFWATWCGPCIAFMPDLAEVQAQYRDNGLMCIGLTVRDPDNSMDKAESFVKKRGPKLKYSFAYADDRSTWDAWMTVAGKNAIPCTFVVDQAGRIGFIGNPIYLGIVAPLVVRGGMSAEAINEEVAKVVKEWDAVSDDLNAGYRTGDHKSGLLALNQFESKHPTMTNNVISVRAKLSALPQIGEFDETKRVAETVIAKAIRQGNSSSLTQVAALLRNGPAKGRKDVMAVAVKAAEAAVRIEDAQDPRTLMDLADTYFAAGNGINAREFAAKAVRLASGESAKTKQDIERRARKLEE